MRLLFGVFALALSLIVSSACAIGANLNPPPLKAPPLPYSPDTGGFYLGVGTFLETANSKVTIGGTDFTMLSNSGSLGGVVGYGRGNGNFWWAVEGGAYWTNLNTGSVCPGCIKSNFTGTLLAEISVPQGVMNVLPNIGTIFPGLNQGAAAANIYPYIGLGVDFDDVSGSFGQSNGRDWQIPFKARVGAKTKLTNGSIMDTWAEASFQGSGFSVGPLATVNQGTTYKAGLTFAVGWGG